MILRRRGTGLLAALLLLGLPLGSAAAAVDVPHVTSVVPVEPGPGSAAGSSAAGSSSSEGELVGTFKVTAGACAGSATGTYFRMIQPGGTTSGPFVQNNDSPCADKTYTAMEAGSDGGLVTGGHQPAPAPAFDSTGNGRADRITAPTRFYGVNFATATNPTDPQTGTKVGAPRIARDGAGKLSGDVRAFAAAWNNQHFNQGSPKPDGTRPGTTAGPTGALDSSTGRFTLDWTSLIVGGPFNNFTGLWHLEGTFVSATAPDADGTTRPAPRARPVAGGSAAANGSRAAVTTAQTGPSFPPAVGFAFLLTAFAGLATRHRVQRVAAAPVRRG